MPGHKLSSYLYWLLKLLENIGLRGLLGVLKLIVTGKASFKIGDLTLTATNLKHLKTIILIARAYREGRIKISDKRIAEKLAEYTGLIRMSTDYGIALSDTDCMYCVKISMDRGELIARMPDGSSFLARYIDPNIFAETFFFDIHFIGFNLSECLVIDVGAFVGDTAIYYAKRGAKVIAVEPLRSNYNALLANVELNTDLKPLIIPINAAIGESSGIREISYNPGSFINGGSSLYLSKEAKEAIKVLTLSDLLKYLRTAYGIELNNSRCRILKMDCKGCEWYVINNEKEVLMMFDILKIEYSGDIMGYTVDKLVKVLGLQGFKCRVWAHHNIALHIGLEKHGTLTCFREMLT